MSQSRGSDFRYKSPERKDHHHSSNNRQSFKNILPYMFCRYSDNKGNATNYRFSFEIDKALIEKVVPELSIQDLITSDMGVLIDQMKKKEAEKQKEIIVKLALMNIDKYYPK